MIRERGQQRPDYINSVSDLKILEANGVNTITLRRRNSNVLNGQGEFWGTVWFNRFVAGVIIAEIAQYSVRQCFAAAGDTFIAEQAVEFQQIRLATHYGDIEAGVVNAQRPCQLERKLYPFQRDIVKTHLAATRYIGMEAVVRLVPPVGGNNFVAHDHDTQVLIYRQVFLRINHIRPCKVRTPVFP